LLLDWADDVTWETAIVRIWTGLFLILLMGGIAEAAEIPTFNTERYCKQVSAAVGGSYVIEKGCRDEEATALVNAQARSVEAQIMSYCTDIAQAIGGSYVILQGCIDDEEEAKKALQ